MASVTVKNYLFPEGYTFSIPGLGGVDNFKPKEIDQSQIQQYEDQGYTFPADGNLVITIKDPPDEVEQQVVEEPEPIVETEALVYRDPKTGEPHPVASVEEEKPGWTSPPVPSQESDSTGEVV